MTNKKLTKLLRLDHLAVWVSDMEKTVSFLKDVVGFKQHPMEVVVSDDDPTCGGMQAYFVDGNGLWLEMILPTSPGPGMDMLNEFGDGAIVEVNFEAVNEDYMNIIDEMAANNVGMLAMDGSPLVDGGQIDEGVTGHEGSKESGQRIAYYPADLSCGTTIEIYELLTDDETNLLLLRNKDWEHVEWDLSAPRADNVSILVEDINKAAIFYTDIIGLKRLPEVIDVPSENGNGSVRTLFIKASETDEVWVQLVQPTSPGHAMDLLNEKGTGYAMELGVEVQDLDKVYDDAKARGITMVNLDGGALEAGEKALTSAHGDRYCYYPLEDSRGLRLKMFQRGIDGASIFQNRDDTFNG
jgi:catechol 2,3-dioxygenase-like lactoylglutathione lyase family enzyme